MGTRQPSPDGAKRTRQLVRQLLAADAVVVSGLARGIDTLAHAHALDHGGRTVAVLGTPLDVASPAENAALQERIGAHGLLVSEFAPGSVVTRRNFPRRNRTMALLSDATVIVEAGATSGTVSQGWEAVRLGRPLFLLRSLVDVGHAWTKDLIAHGAFVLHDVEQVLEVVPTEMVHDTAPF